jgi:hypothetical protein
MFSLLSASLLVLKTESHRLGPRKREDLEEQSTFTPTVPHPEGQAKSIYQRRALNNPVLLGSKPVLLGLGFTCGPPRWIAYP